MQLLFKPSHVISLACVTATISGTFTDDSFTSFIAFTRIFAIAEGRTKIEMPRYFFTEPINYLVVLTSVKFMHISKLMRLTKTFGVSCILYICNTPWIFSALFCVLPSRKRQKHHLFV